MDEQKFGTNELDAYLKVPLRHARTVRGQLVPVVGAGLSRAIGLPSWPELTKAVSGAVHEPLGDASSMASILMHASQKLPKAGYESLILEQLDTPENKTSLAHQALVAAGLEKIITTNLDFAIERAFEMADVPLRPENVIVGDSDAFARLPSRPRAGTILYKIHGSLEDPKSWILKDDEYDREYVSPRRLADWWEQLNIPMLFVGFSFSDEDIAHSLRVLEVRRSVRGYAILHLDQVRQQRDKLKKWGISPIAYVDVKQIPELLDDIFICAPVRIIASTDLPSGQRQIRVGASKIELPPSADPNFEKDVWHSLANALEFAPMDSSVDDKRRRYFGERGQFIGSLQKLVSDPLQKKADSDSREVQGPTLENEKCATVIRGLVHYPDVIFSQLIPGIISDPKVNARLLTIIWQCADDWLQARLKNYALNLLEKPIVEDKEKREKRLDSAAIRGIAFFVAETTKAHPAMKMPPIVVGLGKQSSFCIAKYPLTRHQVSQLRKEKGQGHHPIRPYTIDSVDEAERIMWDLNDQFSSSGRWRLPTDVEWRELLSASPGKWPWGEADPEKGVHAHLSFNKVAIAKHPLEVGTFVGDIMGGSPLRDLIGNVYELVDESDGPGRALAGGGWTTRFPNSSPNKFSVISKLEPEHTNNNNVGIRPVLVLSH